MTRDSKKSTPSGETLKEFIEKEQELLVRYLEISHQQRKITDTYYNFALTETCEAEDWDGAIEHFEEAFRAFIDQAERYDYYRLVERVEQGGEYLASTDPSDPLYAKGEALYEQLCEQLCEQLQQY